jgi:phosphomannomutase
MALMMSVSGIRGLIGQTLTPVLATEAACAFGSHLGRGVVVVGRDSRPSGLMVSSAVTAGLLSVGCDVVDLGVATTPATALNVIDAKAIGGMVITASHNPLPWNGLKFLLADAIAPPPETAEKIFAAMRAKAFHLASVDSLGKLLSDSTAAATHVKKVLTTIPVAAIRDRRFKVVLDSVNGAGGPEGRMLLEELGCTVIQINGEPTGQFAHTPEPLAENLTGLCDEVRKQGADAGFAQDPDADRLAIVDDRGRYMGEECTVVLASMQALKERVGPVAVNLSTSRMIDDVAARFGARVHRTAVGEANVARAVVRHNCIIGGEGNGGVIDPRVVHVRDSLVAMARTLALLADQKRSLSAVVDELPRYAMIKQKFEMDRSSIDKWLGRIRGSDGKGKIDESDGLRIDWPEGWVHVRPSNTEPIARIIAEAADAEAAEKLAKRVSDLR